MKNNTNYHSHCSFCDGKATIEEFVQEAVRQKFESYGVSSHAPLPFSTKWTLDSGRVGEYLSELQRIKAIYSDRIELYVGLEIDYLDDNHHPASHYFQSLPLDYRIGSVHLLHGTEGEVVDIDTSGEIFKESVTMQLGGDLKQVVLTYFDKLMMMVDRGGFDIVGHPDKISMNASFCQPDITSERWYREKIGDYFSLIAEKGVLLEVNTKAYSRSGLLFPNRAHFALLKKLRIPIVVNSDAHFPQHINLGRREALLYLLHAGIKTVWQLKQGLWQETAIEID